MSLVKIQGNASGTGEFTIAAPNSNTNRTLTLPDNTGTILTGSSAITRSQLPAGSVLQVLQTTTTSAITTTSTSFVTTSFSLSITPTASSSKILIFLNGGGAYENNSGAVSMWTTIYRGATNVGDATYGLSRHSTDGGSFIIAPHSISYLDSPSTTSSTTYTAYFRSSNGTQVDFSNNDRGTVALTLMEIAA
jgi:hypothetical protein